MRGFSVPLLCAVLHFQAFADSIVPDGNYHIETVAGSNWAGDGGPALSAVLLQTEGVCVDAGGNLYIADAGDNRVRKVSPGGLIQTVAGTGIRGFAGDGGPASAALLNSPYGLACGASGNLYFADLGNGRVRRVAPNGVITTIAAGLIAPRNVALDSSGVLYVSDFTGHRVYHVASDGSLTVVAGTGSAGAAGDGGSADHAQLAFPAGLAFDRFGALYVADSGNHLVRKIENGVITSVARAASPTGLTFDPFGNLYIADPNGGQILAMPPGETAFSVMAVPAQDLAFGPDGSLYISESLGVVRQSPAGAITAFAGGGDSAHGDQGPAIAARLNHPAGVAVDAQLNLYIADRDNHRIRRVTQEGTIMTVAGTGVSGDEGDGGPAVKAQLSTPSSVSIDRSGNLYIADTGNQRVREIAPDGTMLNFLERGLIAPVYAIPDNAGNVYIADADRILKSTSGGPATTIVSGLKSPRGLALDSSGNLYFTEMGAARVRRLSSGGTLTDLGAGLWRSPTGIAVDSSGDVFVTDAGLQQVLMIDPSGAARVIAGDGTDGFSGDEGPALSARLGLPWDIAALPDGSIVIADLDNNRVRLLRPVASPAGTSSPPPIPQIVNAASLQPGPIAPGTLLLIRNTGIPAEDLQNTQVTFDDAAGQIVSAETSGILVVSPQSIAGSASVTIKIADGATVIASIPAAVTDSAVALFEDAAGDAAANNQDGSLNSAAQPAARGSVISLYGTGLGISGAKAAVTIGGFPAEVLYCGAAPQYPGLFQVNVRIPAGYIPPGALPVSVSEGNSSSQTGVVVWVN